MLYSNVIFAWSVWVDAGLIALIRIFPNDTAFDVIKRVLTGCTKEQCVY